MEIFYTLLHQCQWPGCDTALYCTILRGYHWGKLGSVQTDRIFPYYFLQLHVNLNYLRVKNLPKKRYIYTVEYYTEFEINEL